MVREAIAGGGAGARMGRRARTAFTLIELLVVVAIIAVLISILVPSLNNARRAASGVYCMSNVKNLFLPLRMYMDEFEEVLPGWMQGWFTVPDPGQTTWYLEARRMMGSEPAGFPDSLAIWNDPAAWVDQFRMLLCPEDPKWGPSQTYGSYATNYSCWTYYMTTDGDTDVYCPTTTQFFNFRQIRKPQHSVMISEILHHAGYEVMDDTSQTGNVLDPAYVAGGWTAARHFHPPNQSTPDDSGQYFWEGTNNYLFFDGHVDPLQYPPYRFGTGSDKMPAGSNLPTYTQFVQ